MSLRRQSDERNRFAVASQMTSSAASPRFYPSDLPGQRASQAVDQVAAYAEHRVKPFKN
jgi:hypothetical protein